MEGIIGGPSKLIYSLAKIFYACISIFGFFRYNLIALCEVVNLCSCKLNNFLQLVLLAFVIDVQTTAALKALLYLLPMNGKTRQTAKESFELLIAYVKVRRCIIAHQVIA